MTSTIRRTVTAGIAAALLLTACVGDEGGDTADDLAGEQPTDDALGGEQPTDGGEEATDGGIQPATVALFLDGRRVPVTAACNGVDGAVLATTEGEVTVALVREEGTALRYRAEGLTAETDQVEVEEIGVSTIYRGTIASDEVPAVDVELELSDTSVLDDC